MRQCDCKVKPAVRDAAWIANSPTEDLRSLPKTLDRRGRTAQAGRQPELTRRGQSSRTDPVLGHHFLIQFDAQPRLLRHTNITVHHGEALLRQSLPQGALLDA